VSIKSEKEEVAPIIFRSTAFVRSAKVALMLRAALRRSRIVAGPIVFGGASRSSRQPGPRHDFCAGGKGHCAGADCLSASDSDQRFEDRQWAEFFGPSAGKKQTDGASTFAGCSYNQVGAKGLPAANHRRPGRGWSAAGIIRTIELRCHRFC